MAGMTAAKITESTAEIIIGTTWVLATGTTFWSGTVTLAEGPNTISARATDTASNTATISIAVTVEFEPETPPPGFQVSPTIIIVAGAGAVAVVIIVASVSVYLSLGSMLSPTTQPPPPPPPPPSPPPPEPSDCPRSIGLCIERDVTRVIDGDTLDVEGGLRIRLVLDDALELSESGGPEALDYLADLCLGSLALIDEDDFQIGDDPYGRILAVVYCNGTNANAALISSGHADTYYSFCSASEFGSESWTGCSSPPPPPPPAEDCDLAYPDVCIPPPPPDLNCGDISYRNFRVLPPDPHNFDGDGDGIGCES